MLVIEDNEKIIFKSRVLIYIAEDPKINRLMISAINNKVKAAPKYWEKFSVQKDVFRQKLDPSEYILSDLLVCFFEKADISKNEVLSCLEGSEVDLLFLRNLNAIPKLKLDPRIIVNALPVMSREYFIKILKRTKEIHEMGETVSLNHSKENRIQWVVSYLLYRYAYGNNKLDSLLEWIKDPSKALKEFSGVKKRAKVIL